MRPNELLVPSEGPDGAIKDVALVTTPQYNLHFQENLATSFFPHELMAAKVPPIFKRDDPLNLINDRPTTAPNASSKIFEHKLHKQTSDYPSEHNES